MTITLVVKTEKLDGTYETSSVGGAFVQDYDAKYNNAGSKLFIPAHISDELAEKVRKTAAAAYTALGCEGLSRVDFFVTDEGRILLNEINTLPGFTSISMYPKLMAASGIDGSELIEKLISLAFERAGKNV